MDIKTAALISQNRHFGRDNALLYDGFFSFAVVRQITFYAKHQFCCMLYTLLDLGGLLLTHL